jgi:hypothetical protein
MLAAPHLSTLRPWFTTDTAPAAVAAAAAIFMAAIWPFWPALAAGSGERPGTFLGRSLLEAAILLALAAPFLVVASALADRPPAGRPSRRQPPAGV